MVAVGFDTVRPFLYNSLMMKTITSIALAVAGISSFAAGLEPWQDPNLNEINRLPARTLIVPCETEDIAIGVANGEKSKYD